MSWGEEGLGDEAVGAHLEAAQEGVELVIGYVLIQLAWGTERSGMSYALQCGSPQETRWVTLTPWRRPTLPGTGPDFSIPFALKCLCFPF